MNKKMLIGLSFGAGYGSQPGAWRMPWVNPTSFADFDIMVKQAQTAERGKLHFLFLPDGFGTLVDIESVPPMTSLDVMMTLAAVARETKHIGLLATGSTTFNEPYNLARQFKALDVMSHGRAGWNAITSSTNDAAANYGVTIPSSEERYGRAHEAILLIQALWGSWGRNAWIHDQASGKFANKDQILPINLQGKFVGARGPLYIPPSEQGQPIIVHAGGSPNAHQLGGRFADVVIGSAFTIEDARSQRQAFRDAAEGYGRNPDDIKFFAGLMTTITKDRRTALDRRILLTEKEIPQRVAYLQSMLRIPLSIEELGRPLSELQLSNARPSPYDPRSAHALKIAKEGWSLRDIIAHGVIDYHPVIVGSGIEAADHMQAWFEAEAADGFWISTDVYADGIDAFVDEVVPILQERGLFHKEYEGRTLRENLGIQDQYGIDPRIVSTQKY
ncbi:NtaA/DmoA family FMN-dependent monooxygenase [Chryseobacterium sp. 09-1422]|uniref:NtaA/DmoA family FMN-dependent monooxygenase n=1 Tax=Chryseobacterium kimseyorum TaxID=2984028 RepID=A0ABT3I3T6_9FLAO|nr:NtaA/DmoA family FMN-dependent monooxygenase [Chryseobacterium kimseyorum]MCW3170732.1 NtaA/DmoA family FMN-dependent monooxygenase [Chryseobacterium kimseyorum]